MQGNENFIAIVGEILQERLKARIEEEVVRALLDKVEQSVRETVRNELHSLTVEEVQMLTGYMSFRDQLDVSVTLRGDKDG